MTRQPADSKRQKQAQRDIRQRLTGHLSARVLERCSLVWYTSRFLRELDPPDPIAPYDVLVLLSDDLLEERNIPLIIDDHSVHPFVFARVRSLPLLRQDIRSRLSIALWLYTEAHILQDYDSQFSRLIETEVAHFKNSLPDLIRTKYVHFRSERHYLRDTLRYPELEGMTLSTELIKCTVAKLAIELAFLAERRPYPYNKWLWTLALSNSPVTASISEAARRFLQEQEPAQTIQLSDQLVTAVSDAIAPTGLAISRLLTHWWQFLP